MSTSSATMTSTAHTNDQRAFWEKLWRQSGFTFVPLFLIAYVLYGVPPQIGASAETVDAYYVAHRTRILIAAVFSGQAVLYLLWFGAAIRATLSDAGQDGWGAAATAASTAVGGLFLLGAAIGAALAYSIAGSGAPALLQGLNTFVWACVVLSSFPRAMLIMAGTFGLWRAGQVSNAFFGAGVAALVLVLLGGTTWMHSGFWAPDGAYSRLVSPIIGLVWILFTSRVLLARS